MIHFIETTLASAKWKLNQEIFVFFFRSLHLVFLKKVFLLVLQALIWNDQLWRDLDSFVGGLIETGQIYRVKLKNFGVLHLFKSEMPLS